MLRKGPWISPDVRGEGNYTALHNASSQGHLQIMQLLMQEGASCDSVTPLGITPLHLASTASVANYLLHLHLQKFAYVLPSHIYANLKDWRGNTPLHYAASAGRTDVVEAIVASEGNVHAEARFSITPLHSAAECGHDSTMTKLLELGTQVDSVSKFGETALHMAARQGHAKAVLVLLKWNADINAVSISGYTPLFEAIFASHAHVVDILISANANVNVGAADGNTPLSIATQRCNAQIVEKLKKVDDE